jgi:hypothetical protein
MSTTSNTFPLFPDFPVEIRLKIWRFALVPRLVSWPMHRPGVPRRRGCTEYFGGVVRDQLALFVVNKESRNEAARLYHKAFSFTRYINGRPWEYEALFFDFEIDTLFIDTDLWHLLAGRAEGSLAQLRYVALYDTDTEVNVSPEPEQRSFHHLANLFSKCGKLERLSLCLYDPYVSTYRNTRGQSVTTDKANEYKRKLDKALKSYWARLSGQGGQFVRKEEAERWARVVRVVYFSELRKQAGMADDQRAYIEMTRHRISG